jgi:hypothetical protein
MSAPTAFTVFTENCTMTTAKTNIALAEEGADADLFKQMILYVAQRMMEMDAESLCAAGYAREVQSA